MSDDITQDSGSWERTKPRIQDALEFLHTTAEDLANSRSIDIDVRAAALSLAQRLAAELANFGLEQAAQQAQVVVGTLNHAGLPQPERLQQQVGALRASLAPSLEE